MLEKLKALTNISSHTLDVEGILKALQWVKKEIKHFVDEIQEIPLPPYKTLHLNGKLHSYPLGSMLLAKKREHLPLQIVLGGHIDTVYPNLHPLTEEGPYLKGSGVADMKGGLIVMIEALRRFEKSEKASKLGWTLFINPDEEIGSYSSTTHLEALAAGKEYALLFEPSPLNGACIDERLGSLTFQIHIKGKSAHAGKNFHEGRSAIMEGVYLLHTMQNHFKEDIFNIGEILGGEGANIVAENLLLKGTIRSHDIQKKEEELQMLCKKEHVTLHILTKRFPMKPNDLTKKLHHILEKVSSTPIIFEKSGGVTDGNTFSHFGLGVIDNLGVMGGGLHTSEEFMVIDSLEKRVELTLSMLYQIADGA